MINPEFNRDIEKRLLNWDRPQNKLWRFIKWLVRK
jgi:hypothetical protein